MHSKLIYNLGTQQVNLSGEKILKNSSINGKYMNDSRELFFKSITKSLDGTSSILDIISGTHNNHIVIANENHIES